MNYNIKTVDKFDFDFILSLNQKTLPEVSSTDLVGMSYFLKNSSYFKIILHNNHPVGFCIGLMPGKDYSAKEGPLTSVRHHTRRKSTLGIRNIKKI